MNDGVRTGEESQASRALRLPKAWHRRGYLPHFDQINLIQSITFRTFDAVPADVIERWKDELQLGEKSEAQRKRAGETPALQASLIKLRKRIAEYEDAGHGNAWLRTPKIAGLIENALRHFDQERYRLMAWCIMPNHVHVLLETKEGWPVSNVLHAWKSYTSKEANKLLGRSGSFWMNDYHDRVIRDEKHFRATVEYIEHNPVKAGLCVRPEDWPFSSACTRFAGETPAFPA